MEPHEHRARALNSRTGIFLLAGLAAIAAIVVLWIVGTLGGSGYQVHREVTLWQNPDPAGRWIDRMAECVLAFSAEGKWMAATDNEESILLIDMQTGQVVKKLPLPDDPLVESMAFTESGREVVFADASGRAEIWEIDSATLKKEIVFAEAPLVKPVGSAGGSIVTYSFNDVLISRNGGRIACGYRDDTFKIWNVENGEVEITLAGLAGQRLGAISANGKLIALCSDADEVSIWDVDRAPARQLCTARFLAVGPVEFSPDGTIVATVEDRDVHLWDVQSGARLRTLRHAASLPADGMVDAIAFSPDGGRLAAGANWSNDPWWTFLTGRDLLFRQVRAEVSVWDVATGRVLDAPVVRHASVVAFSADGGILAVGSDHGTITLWTQGER